MKVSRQGNCVKATPETDDDLWLLSQLVGEGDHVTSLTFRKITIGDSATDRNVKTIRKRMKLTIQTEKVEFQQGTLRILGTILQGPDDVNKGDHHSFSLEPGTMLSIQKERWPNYMLERLKQAQERTGKRVLLCAFDRDTAAFALASEASVKTLSTLHGSMQKKADVQQVTSNFYSEIAKNIAEYVKRHDIQTILLASPAFWKEYLLQELKSMSGLEKAKVITGTVNTGGEQGIAEIIKRPEMQTALTNMRVHEEQEQIERFLQAIAKDKPVCYGKKDCSHAASLGAVQELLVSEAWIGKMRTEGDKEFEQVMELVEQTGGEVHLIGEHEAGKKLDGLGGIAGFLRYTVS